MKRGKGLGKAISQSHYLSKDSTPAGACREMLIPGVGPSAAMCALPCAVKVASLAPVPAHCCILSEGHQEPMVHVKIRCFQIRVDGTLGTSFHRRKL